MKPVARGRAEPRQRRIHAARRRPQSRGRRFRQAANRGVTTVSLKPTVRPRRHPGRTQRRKPWCHHASLRGGVPVCEFLFGKQRYRTSGLGPGMTTGGPMPARGRCASVPPTRAISKRSRLRSRICASSSSMRSAAPGSSAARCCAIRRGAFPKYAGAAWPRNQPPGAHQDTGTPRRSSSCRPGQHHFRDFGEPRRMPRPVRQQDLDKIARFRQSGAFGRDIDRPRVRGLRRPLETDCFVFVDHAALTGWNRPSPKWQP